MFVVASKIGSGNAGATFSVMIGIVLTFTTISYIVIFPTLIKLRYSHPHVNRPYRVPFGMAGVWFCGVVTTAWAVFASLVAIFPGFGDGKLLNDDDLPTWTDAANVDHVVSRLKYESISFAAIAITILAGVIFYVLGAPTRAKMVDVPLPGNEAAPGLAPGLPAD